MSRVLVVDDEVDLHYYRLQLMSEAAIDLREGEAQPQYGPRAVGTGSADEEVPLSTLVAQLNERFGTAFGPADELFFEQVRKTAVADEGLRQAAAANSLENFTPVFRKQLVSLFLQRMEGNEEIFAKVMNDDRFREAVAGYLVEVVYGELRGEG